jgi:hypothetical protein
MTYCDKCNKTLTDKDNIHCAMVEKERINESRIVMCTTILCEDCFNMLSERIPENPKNEYRKSIREFIETVSGYSNDKH